MKQWIQFFFSRSFIRTIFRLGFVWVLVLGSTWVFLHFYSRHGASQNVPEVHGTLLQEAEQALLAMGLEAVHLDSVYSRSGRAFEVIEQIPPAGSGIKSGRKVYLTTYRSTPPDEKLTVMEGQDLTIARIILENKGFVVEEREEPNIALVGRVIRLEDRRGRLLNPESRLPRGSRIHLISGTTTDEMVRIPNLKGLNLDSARRVLEHSKLSLGLVEYAESVEDASDSARATILNQHLKPRRNQRVPAGTELDLYLGLRGDSRELFPSQH